jgi:hypothetical protein
MHFHNRSVRIAKELNHSELLAASLFRRARTLLRQGRMEQAAPNIALAVKQARGAPDNLRRSVHQMATEVITRLPRSQESTVRYHHVVGTAGRIIRQGTIEDDGIGVHRRMADGLEALSAARGVPGRPETAVRLLASATVWRATNGSRSPCSAEPPTAEALERLRATLGAERFAAAWAAGHALSLEQAIEASADALEMAPDAEDDWQPTTTRVPTFQP